MSLRDRAPFRPGAADLCVAACALAASAAGMFNDFVYDDIPLIRDNTRVHGLAHIGEILRRPYWPPPFVEQLYRPLTSLANAAEFAIGHGAPITFRLVSYTLYVLSALLVYRLATSFLPSAVALATAILFAVHPVHVEAVALGVNQGELIVGILALVSTSIYVEARKHGSISTRRWLALGGIFLAASLTKENGLVIPLLLLAAELTIVRREAAGADPRGSAAGILFLAGIGAGVLLLRRAVLGGDALRVVPAADLEGLSLPGRLVVTLQVVPEWLRLFVWPAHLQVDFGPGELVTPGLFGTKAMTGLLIVCAAIVAVVWSHRKAPVIAFGLLWMIAALLPVANIIPTGILLAERTLFLPSIGFVFAVGTCAAVALDRWPGRGAKRILLAGLAVATVLGLVRSGNRQAAWNTKRLQIIKPGGGTATAKSSRRFSAP